AVLQDLADLGVERVDVLPRGVGLFTGDGFALLLGDGAREEMEALRRLGSGEPIPALPEPAAEAPAASERTQPATKKPDAKKAATPARAKAPHTGRHRYRDGVCVTNDCGTREPGQAAPEPHAVEEADATDEVDQQRGLSRS